MSRRARSRRAEDMRTFVVGLLVSCAALPGAFVVKEIFFEHTTERYDIADLVQSGLRADDVADRLREQLGQRDGLSYVFSSGERHLLVCATWRTHRATRDVLRELEGP